MLDYLYNLLFSIGISIIAIILVIVFRRPLLKLLRFVIKKIYSITKECICDIWFAKGTKQKLIDAEIEIIGKSREEMKDEIDKYYDERITKIDEYLNWYYSLSGKTKLFINGLRTLVVQTEEKNNKELLEDMMRLKTMPDYSFDEAINDLRVEANKELSREIEYILKDGISVKKKNKLYIEKVYPVFEKIYYQACIPEKAITSVDIIGASILGGTAFAAAVNVGVSEIIESAEIVETGAVIGALDLCFGVITAGLIAKGIIKVDEMISRNKYKENLIEALEKEKEAYKTHIDKYFDEHTKAIENFNFSVA